MYMYNLATNFEDVRTGRVRIVMDNVAFRHAAVVDEVCEDNGIVKMYLPPYAPELNPIENVFGVLKDRFRALGVVRTRRAMRVRIGNIIDEMNNELNLQAFYRHMRDFAAMARNNE